MNFPDAIEAMREGKIVADDHGAMFRIQSNRWGEYLLELEGDDWCECPRSWNSLKNRSYGVVE